MFRFPDTAAPAAAEAAPRKASLRKKAVDFYSDDSKKSGDDKKSGDEKAESDDEAGGISLNVDGPDSDSESDSDVDDQTATLLQGFESSDDEDEDEEAGEGETIDAKKLTAAGMPDEKKVKKKLAKINAKGRDKVRFSHSAPSPKARAFPHNDESRKFD